jgi:hypothetical protein
LTGTVLVGATFTVAGEAGTPRHTVTGNNLTATGNVITGLAFTPAAAAGGMANHAAVTFGAASTARGILQREAAMLTGEFAADNVYQVPVFHAPASAITGLVAGDGLLVLNTAYMVRKIHLPDDGAVAQVALAGTA